MLFQNPLPRIGLIGLGLMGQALAGRFLSAGFQVLGWDISAEARAALMAQSGQVAAEAQEPFLNCEIITLSLPDSKVVAEVLDGMADLHGRIIIDTSTGDPTDAETITAAVVAKGGRYVDATISGSSAQVACGQVTLMVGGDAATIDLCRPLLGSIGAALYHVGKAGSGARMKLVTNLVLGLNRAALAEGLSFARALGLDLPQVLEVMQGSMAYSRIMDTKGRKMIESDFSVQARLSQHLKDVRLMLDAAEVKELALPLSEAHRALLEKAEAMGLGPLDNSALIAAYS